MYFIIVGIILAIAFIIVERPQKIQTNDEAQNIIDWLRSTIDNENQK